MHSNRVLGLTYAEEGDLERLNPLQVSMCNLGAFRECDSALVVSALGAVAAATLLLLTQLLQEVGQLAEEAADRVFGLSGIELGLLSGL